MKRKKEIEHICGNCRLFDGTTSTCSVRLLVMGETFRDVPVGTKDQCLWEELGLADEIKEVRFKTIDPMTGEGTNGYGKVVMECDKDFFGKTPG